jgi:hypothetical protein
MSDFVVTSYGSVWNIRAESNEAKEFAKENLPVEGWMGSPTNFTTDHRAARDLIDQLSNEGWEILAN